MSWLDDFVEAISLCQFAGTETVACLSSLFLVGIGGVLCPCLTVVLFQALHHHCFICLMKHLSVVVGREKTYSLEFTTSSGRRGLSNSFWEGKELITMTIAQCGRDVPSVKSSVLLCSQVLSAVSLEPTIICCAGGSADFIKALDKAPSRKDGIQYHFNLVPLQVEKLMHKPSCSVMGKIDIKGADIVGEVVWCFGWNIA